MPIVASNCPPDKPDGRDGVAVDLKATVLTRIDDARKVEGTANGEGVDVAAVGEWVDREAESCRKRSQQEYDEMIRETIGECST